MSVSEKNSFFLKHSLFTSVTSCLLVVKETKFRTVEADKSDYGHTDDPKYQKMIGRLRLVTLYRNELCWKDQKKTHRSVMHRTGGTRLALIPRT